MEGRPRVAVSDDDARHHDRHASRRLAIGRFRRGSWDGSRVGGNPEQPQTARTVDGRLMHQLRLHKDYRRKAESPVSKLGKNLGQTPAVVCGLKIGRGDFSHHAVDPGEICMVQCDERRNNQRGYLSVRRNRWADICGLARGGADLSTPSAAFRNFWLEMAVRERVFRLAAKMEVPSAFWERNRRKFFEL